jgi:hypothetical protein
MLYLEDFHPCDVRNFGDRTVAEDEIIAFGTEFDPQTFCCNIQGRAANPTEGQSISVWKRSNSRASPC